jgi:hypothetical protein
MGRRKRNISGGRHAARPRLEWLEERTLLSTRTVTGLGDAGTGSANSGDLRYRISGAEHAADSIINFAVTGTITLTRGPLVLDGGMDIEGPGAGILTIDGNNKTTVFHVNSGVAATIAGLSIEHGYSDNGGGIYNAGTLFRPQCGTRM